MRAAYLVRTMVGAAVTLAALAAMGTAKPVPSDEGAVLYKRYCSACHPLHVPAERALDCVEWSRTVQRMAATRSRLLGTGIPEEAQTQIAAFLGEGRGEPTD